MFIVHLPVSTLWFRLCLRYQKTNTCHLLPGACLSFLCVVSFSVFCSLIPPSSLSLSLLSLSLSLPLSSLSLSLPLSLSLSQGMADDRASTSSGTTTRVIIQSGDARMTSSLATEEPPDIKPRISPEQLMAVPQITVRYPMT